MPSLPLPNFKYGMDQRRARAAGAVSTLYDLQNAHITRGGDVQRCKAFVPVYALPAGCFGLVAIANRLYTFGSANLAGSVPAGITYQQLVSPNAGSGEVMTSVLTAVAFLGNTYVIAKYSFGNIFHFYNGSRVTDWDTIGAANASSQSMVDYFAELISANLSVDVIAYGKTLLLTSYVPNVATTIAAAGAGGTSATATVIQAAAPGVVQIVQVVFAGAFAATDYVTIQIGPQLYTASGLASGTGVSAYVFGQRIYSCANTHLKYCTLADPTNWTNTNASSGAGFINMASVTNGSERLVGCASYAQYTAIFSARAVRLYLLTQDATQVAFFQYLNNHGSFAQNSFQPFAATDVFYLDLSGIRSLRERDTTYTAYANDVGAAVDTPVQAWLAQVGWGVAMQACSVVEPLDERYMLAIGTRIWVYSYFPATQVGAWSHYDPGFSVLAFATIKNRLYCLGDDNNIYLYGGISGQTYPAANVTPVSLTTPFHGGEDLPSLKIWTLYDTAVTGTWGFTFYLDPDNLSATVNGGSITGSTLGKGSSDNVIGRSKTFSMQATCSSAGYADLSSFIMNYLRKESK